MMYERCTHMSTMLLYLQRPVFVQLEPALLTVYLNSCFLSLQELDMQQQNAWQHLNTMTGTAPTLCA